MNGSPSDEARQRGAQLTRGRKFSADELQLLLLTLLAEEPGHGYGLIRRLEQLSNGYYTPSPGALYPALARLESRGLAKAAASGARKCFNITPAGRAHLREAGERAELLRAILKHAAKKMLWVRHSGESLATAAKATGWLPEFVQARHELRLALLKQGDPDHARQRQLIAVLQRATREILDLADSAPASPNTQGENDEDKQAT